MEAAHRHTESGQDALPGPRRDPGPGRGSLTAVAVWLLALVAAHLLGRWRTARGDQLVLGTAPPFIGNIEVRLGPSLAVAVLLVAAVAWRGRVAARTYRWPLLLLAAWGVAAAFAVALAASTGPLWPPAAVLDALAEPLQSRHDYLAVLPTASADLGAFVQSYTERLPGYPIHVRGHPPGLVVLLVGLDRLGLGGAGWAAVLDVAVGTSALLAVAVTVRSLGGAAGEEAVRRALPAAVLAPAALWIATSPDAFFAGVLSWGVALLALASTRERAWPLALAAGLLLGACPFLSYGLLPMGLLALVVPLVTRRLGPTLLAGAVVVACVLAWASAGFWIADGIAATHEAWHFGRASERPYLYFLLADAVLLGVIIGPAGVGGLAGLRRLARAPRVLVTVALAAAAIGALQGFERGEVERIWLPLAPWVVLAAATIGPRRAWLVAQGGTAVALQVVLAAPW